MILGERNRPNPAVQIPSWTTLFDDPAAGMLYPHNGGDHSPFLLADSVAAWHPYLPSNETDPDSDVSGLEPHFAMDQYSTDEFRMFEFKVRRCERGRAHDWTECPFAHPGEKAKRRDPRKFHYSGTACPGFRKGSCKKGEACEYAHGVFECWLHPSRYRTQPCKDGTGCRRRVCFFAHTPEQLRVLCQQQQQQQSPRASVESYDGSPLRKSSLASSPTFSPSPDSASPPLSPNGPSVRRTVLSNSVNEVLAFSLQQLQLSRAKSLQWGMQLDGLDLGSPFRRLPSTPTGAMMQTMSKTAGRGWLDVWEKGSCLQQVEPENVEQMERVESGRDLRTKVFEKLCRENAVASDVGWVSEPVK